jgi:Protein of unknown function (DUF2786)
MTENDHHTDNAAAHAGRSNRGVGTDGKNLARIAALLRKAEGTDNEHEADAYLQAAQRLATLASVDLAVARAVSAASEQRAVPTHRAVEIGEAGKRGLRTYVQLFLAVGRANDLICDIARNSTLVYAYGFEPDIDAAEALYASLVVQMVRASDTFIHSGAYAADVVQRQVALTVPGRTPFHRPTVKYVLETKPVHATTARINFQQAFAARVGERLLAARSAARTEALTQPRPDDGASISVELVLRDREVELRDHYSATSRARGKWTGNRQYGRYSELARRAGDAAGRTARLTAQKEIGGRRVALPR